MKNITRQDSVNTANLAVVLGMLLVLVLTACGKPSDNVATPTAIPDSACRVVDHCTYSTDSTIMCVAAKFTPTFGDGAVLPVADYQGSPCIITKQDFTTVSGQSCGWGSSNNTCTSTTQGPGLPALPSDSN